MTFKDLYYISIGEGRGGEKGGEGLFIGVTASNLVSDRGGEGRREGGEGVFIGVTASNRSGKGGDW